MREKLSITINTELLRKLETLLDNAAYRNKSHILEIALQKFLAEKP